MEEVAPNEWLINFTNPASIITETITRYTKVKVIGLCNVPLGMEVYLDAILDQNAKYLLQFYTIQ